MPMFEDDDDMIEINREFTEAVARSTERLLSVYSREQIAEMTAYVGCLDMEHLGDGDYAYGSTIAAAAQLTLLTFLCLHEFGE